MTDFVGSDSRAGQRALRRDCAEVCGRMAPERAAEGPETGAHGRKEDYALPLVAHGMLRGGAQPEGRANDMGLGIWPHPRGPSSKLVLAHGCAATHAVTPPVFDICVTGGALQRALALAAMRTKIHLPSGW